MKQLRITVEGKVYEVTVEVLGESESAAPQRSGGSSRRPAASASAAAAAPAPSAPSAAAGDNDLTSPLSGKVVSIDAPQGSTVKAGDTVVTLEAMKMNTVVSAPKDGKVTAVHVTVGDGVDEGQPLLTIE